jgi:hypothetical protein
MPRHPPVAWRSTGPALEELQILSNDQLFEMMQARDLFRPRVHEVIAAGTCRGRRTESMEKQEHQSPGSRLRHTLEMTGSHQASAAALDTLSLVRINLEILANLGFFRDGNMVHTCAIMIPGRDSALQG